MKTILLTTTFLLLFSCGKGDSLSDQRQVDFSLFSSSSDPCLVPEKCSDRKVVPPHIAKALLDKSAYNSTPILGTKVSRNVVTTRSTTVEVEDENGERKYEEISCAISYDMTRTVVDLDPRALYVREEKENFQYKPNTSACRNFGTMKEFKSLLITLEERSDLNPDIELPISESEMRKLKMETLTVDGKPMMRIDGTINRVQPGQDIDGNPTKIPVETSILTMIDLTRSYFSGIYFSHTLNRVPGLLPSETIENKVEIKGLVDVSSFRIEDYTNSILDRRGGEKLRPENL